MTNQLFDLNKILTSTFIEKVVEIKKNIAQNYGTQPAKKFFKSLTKIFLKDSKIVIFVYDIAIQESFEEMNYWVTTVKEILGEALVFGLVGNKKDLYMKEEINEDTIFVNK